MTHRDKTDPESSLDIILRYEKKARRENWTRNQLADALKNEIGRQLAGGPNKDYLDCLKDARDIINKIIQLREGEDTGDDLIKGGRPSVDVPMPEIEIRKDSEGSDLK